MIKSVANARTLLRIDAAIVGGTLPGSSDVVWGLKNQPVGCAMGIALADCLPGTAGHNNGGGKLVHE